MSAGAVIDLEPLLAPLSDTHPCGPSLKHDPVYDAIAAARRADDPTLPQGVWEAPLKAADWPAVIDLCAHALADRSKDIRIAAWLGEALISQRGIDGGIAGTRLMHGLCEQYWERGLHPEMKRGDSEFRSLPLAWADDKWSDALLLRVVLVKGGGADAVSHTLGHWSDATATENSARKSKQAMAAALQAGAPTQERILEQAAQMQIVGLQDNLAGVRAWKTALLALQLTLDLRLENGTGSLSKLQRTLTKCEDLLEMCLARHPQYHAAPPPAAPEIPFESPAIMSTPETPAPAQLRGRDDAYRQLAVIADYLARVEPHSPVPSLIRRAILWGNMSFDELMREMMQGGGELQKILLRDGK